MGRLAYQYTMESITKHSDSVQPEAVMITATLVEEHISSTTEKYRSMDISDKERMARIRTGQAIIKHPDVGLSLLFW